MFELNTVVSFNTKAPSVLQDHFARVTIVAKMDHVFAGRISGQNIKVLAGRVAAAIGPTFTTTFDKLHYLIVKTQAGATVVVAEEWVETSSVVLETSTTDTLVITGMSTLQRNALLGFINSVGINNYTHQTT